MADLFNVYQLVKGIGGDALALAQKQLGKRLTDKEKEILATASKSDGDIMLVRVMQEPAGWLQVGGLQFGVVGDPQSCAEYREALMKLFLRGYVEQVSSQLYVLTGTGWSRGKKEIKS